MTNWIAKIKRVIEAYLATQDDMYITTENGLLLEIVDLQNFSESTKHTTSWDEPTKS